MLMAAGIQVGAHGQTDIGRERRDNEDQLLVAAPHKVVEITHTSLPDPYRTRVDSGAGSEPHPEIGQVALEPGDALLKCTDGLTKHVPDAAIARLLASSVTATREALSGAAPLGSGSDNVTVAVGRFAA